MTKADFQSFYENDHKDYLEIKKLRHVIRTSSNGVIIIDKQGIISCCNEKASEIIGISQLQLIKEKLSHVIEDELFIEQLLKRFEKQEKQLLKISDKEVLVDFIPFEIRGGMTGATLIVHDLSSFETVLKEIKLKSQVTERLDSIVEYSYDGIYITDGSANTMRINKAYERITGLKREDMMHKNMKALVEEGYISRSGSLLAIEKKETISLNQTFKTGKKALITSKPVFDDNGDIAMVVTNVRDITELYTLKNQLEEQSQLAEKYYNEAKALKTQLLDTSDLIVEDKKMIDLLYSAKKIAMTDITVHVSGESGVGKEVIAKFIHNNSLRTEGHFIKVNCGAIPENLIESELFGYEKGAYTGASKEGKPGLFEMASGGTLFLDEIGELPLNMQVKLLRVLQEGELTRVGGIKPIKVDVRIISATNRNLEKMVKHHEFREDLFYRLNVIPLFIPPLRDRADDILKLITYFLDLINAKYGFNKRFDKDALEVLLDYGWPGNIRELKNVIDRVAVMSTGDVISPDVLPQSIFNEKVLDKFNEEVMPLKDAIIEVEGRLIENAYKQYGNVRDAAKALGIDASTFVRKRKRYMDYQEI